MDNSIKNNVILSLSFSIISFVKLIFTYILTSKWICCRDEPKSLLNVIPSCFDKKQNYEEDKKNSEEDKLNSKDDEEENQQKQPLCRSGNLVGITESLHIFSKVLIIVSNIIYLAVVPKPDQPELHNSKL